MMSGPFAPRGVSPRQTNREASAAVLHLPQPARLEAPIEPGLGNWGAIWGLAVLNNVLPTLGMLLSLILSATLASAQTSTPNRDQVTMRGTVQAVDVTARTVTIKGDTGNVVTLDVPQSVVRLDEVKVGDVLCADFDVAVQNCAGVRGGEMGGDWVEIDTEDRVLNGECQ